MRIALVLSAWMFLWTAGSATAQVQVITCGTGSPLPDPDRASSCVAVIANGEMIVIDSGPGSSRKLQTLNVPLANLRGVFLTHMHSDHLGDAGELMTQSWIAGRSAPLNLYGPAGVEKIGAGLLQMYAADMRYRVDHHGEAQLPPKAFGVAAHALEPKGDGRVVAYEANGWKVEAFLVDHKPIQPALGYRIEKNGRVVVVSGDTVRSANLARHAAGADLLIHEVMAKDLVTGAVALLKTSGQQRRGKMFADVLDYHASPEDAAWVAAEAHADTLVLTHMVPVPTAQNEARFTAGIADVFKGKVVMAKDGQRFNLPAK